MMKLNNVKILEDPAEIKAIFLEIMLSHLLAYFTNLTKPCLSKEELIKSCFRIYS
jgi:hypothetical protein